MEQPRVDIPVGRDREAQHFFDLADPQWRGEGRRPLMVVEGGSGHGKTHFLSWAASTLYDYGVPYAYVDLADPRHPDTVSVLSHATSVNAAALGRTREEFGPLEFPRLWLALLAIRLDLSTTGPETEGNPEGEREQMQRIVRHVGSRDHYSLGWLGDQLERAGRSIPPAEILGVAESPFDAFSYLLSFLGGAVSTVDEAFQWFGGKERDTVDALVALHHQAQDPGQDNPSVGRTNSALVAEFLCKALLADMRVLTKRQRSRPTPTLFLDNAHKGAGPELLTELTRIAEADETEHLTVVAATPGGHSGVVGRLPAPEERPGRGHTWDRLKLEPFTRGEIDGLLTAELGGSRHASEVADHLWEYTLGHPGATVKLVEAWVGVGGRGFGEALEYRPDPAGDGRTGDRSTEDLMLEEALGERFDLVTRDLRAALVSCSAAQEVDAGLWLYRNQREPEHEIGETILLEYPLWEEHGVTVLRRLLQRRLAAREPGGPYPDWSHVHGMLSRYYREEQPNDVAEAYHMLCEGHLYRVAEHLERWLKDDSVNGAQWVRRLRGVAHAPLRSRLHEPYFDALLDAMTEQLDGTDPTPTTRSCLKLVAARRFLNDPDVFRTTELHAACQQTLTDLAAEFVGEGQSRLLDEAGRHANLWGLYR